MAKCLEEFREKQLTEFDSQLNPSEQGLSQHLLTCINTALTRYQEWTSRQRPM